MRKAFAAVAVAGLGLFSFSMSLRAADEPAKTDAKGDEVTGVLIDQKCGNKQMSKDDPEAAAAKHPKSCAISCAESGYGVVHGKKFLKFDDKGNELAKAFLEKHDSTKVTVHGTEKGDEIAVTAIDAAESK